MPAGYLRREGNPKLPGASITKASSTNGEQRSPLHGDRQGCFSDPATDESQKPFAFLSLPTEIRLEIYDLLLICRFDRRTLSDIGGDTSQKELIPSCVQGLKPAILQTCKQVYEEAIPILYSRNVFRFNMPAVISSFLTKIGATNIKLLKFMHIFVRLDAEILPWLEILDTLSEKGTGLRCINLGWGSQYYFFSLGETKTEKRGLGDNLLFVRALAKFTQLEKLHIFGFYAKHWPSYLREKTGAQVHAEGCCLPEFSSYGDEEKSCIRGLNEELLQLFEVYQKETEDLIP